MPAPWRWAVRSATAIVTPTVTAYVGGAGKTIAAQELQVLASRILPVTGNSADASASGSSGGLIGVVGTVSVAQSNGTVQAYASPNSTLNISGTAVIRASVDSTQRSVADGNAYGLVAVGGNSATASSSTVIDAYLAEGVRATGGAFSIQTGGTEYNLADASAGSGGVIAGSAALALTISTTTSTASIKAGADVDVASLRVVADHTAKFNALADSTSAALLGASGALASNTVDSKVNVAMADADISAKDIDLQANNRILKDWITGRYNATSGSGGALDLPAVASISTISNTTSINVADGALLEVIASTGGDNGKLSLSTLNDVTARDRTKLDSGGAISVARAESKILTTSTVARSLSAMRT